MAGDAQPHRSTATSPHRMLASALAGRSVEVITGHPGEPTWSDGHTITLDPDLDAKCAVEAVVTQAALIGAGSLSQQLMRTLLRRSRLQHRFLSIEGPRSIAELRDLLPRSLTYMVCDDIAGLSDCAATSMATARSRVPLPDSGLCLGTLRPREVLATARSTQRRSPPQESGEDRRAGGHAESPARADTSRTGIVATRLPDDSSFFSAGTGSTLIGRVVRRLLRGAGLAASDGPVGGDATSASGAAGNDAGNTAIRGPVADGSATGLSGHGFRYPEWDHRIQAYRPQWCTVRVVEAEHGQMSPMRPLDLGLRRPLARLGNGADSRHRQPRGDDIDIDAAIDTHLNALSGHGDDEETFYLDTVRNRRDLSALILLDVSGSTGERGVGRTRVHDHQRTAVAALATTMHRLGDRVAVYAFSSHGRHHVRLTTVKSFGDHSDTTLLARLHQLRPSGYSRLGAAIRHGASIIEKDGGTSRRLLIVVSDGLAFDNGYDMDYGACDVRRALAEVRARGTGCLCLTVGATAPSQDLERAFGTAAHAWVPRPDHLAPAVFRLCRAALRSAEVRRPEHLRGPQT